MQKIRILFRKYSSAESPADSIIQILIKMNGNYGASHNLPEETMKLISSTSIGFRSSADAIRKYLHSESRQKEISSKSSNFDISDLRRNPETFKSLIETAIRIEKEQSVQCTFELNFSIHYKTLFGERIAVTGGAEFLGNWDPLKGLELEWSEGDIWTVNILLGEGALSDFEYKYVCIKNNGIQWEQGENKVFKVSDGVNKSRRLTYTYSDTWSS